MSSQSVTTPHRPLAHVGFACGLIIFWIYATVPAWLREPSIPSTGHAHPAVTTIMDNQDISGWTGHTYFKRTFLVATSIHPDSAVGRAVRAVFPGDYYIIALGIDNTRGLEPVTVEIDSARMFTFSGTSEKNLLPPLDNAEKNDAHILWKQSYEACRDIPRGAVARTALLLFPGTMDADRFYALQIRINQEPYIIEGNVLSRAMKRDMKHSLRIMTLQENDPILRLKRAELPDDFSPPLTLDIAK